MRKALLVLVAAIFISNLMISPCFASDPMKKLGRGLVNTITGVVEIPKKVYTVSKNDNVALGLTWGLVKGVAVGMLRTAAGLYETVTFPIPAPADYEPMMEPEFVFEDWN
ncbi:MAG: exosortase system-associated protein, TIGR04073 family [Candidatus Omnitrophica bacterium]|nr:exosortase system-associated protein, TIGR04073 family [Candidatus Omnitrophota bacterium]